MGSQVSAASNCALPLPPHDTAPPPEGGLERPGGQRERGRTSAGLLRLLQPAEEVIQLRIVKVCHRPGLEGRLEPRKAHGSPARGRGRKWGSGARTGGGGGVCHNCVCQPARKLGREGNEDRGTAGSGKPLAAADAHVAPDSPADVGWVLQGRALPGPSFPSCMAPGGVEWARWGPAGPGNWCQPVVLRSCVWLAFCACRSRP